VRREKSKAPLALMEQLIMILVFALAAAICIQAFVYADRLSKSGERKEMAFLHMQEVAENCKAKAGNLKQVCDILQGEEIENGIKIGYDDKIEVLLILKETDSEYLQRAELSAYEEGGEKICAMEIAWQKEGKG